MYLGYQQGEAVHALDCTEAQTGYSAALRAFWARGMLVLAPPA